MWSSNYASFEDFCNENEIDYVSIATNKKLKTHAYRDRKIEFISNYYFDWLNKLNLVYLSGILNLNYNN